MRSTLYIKPVDHPVENNTESHKTTNFESEPRPKFLQLLGYDKNELSQKVVTHINTKTDAIGVSGDGQRPDPVIQTGLGTVPDEKGVVADEQGNINAAFT